MGFILTPEERDALVTRDPRNAERIFPYIGGEEINTSPTQEFDRYVIDFGSAALEVAGEWPDLIRIIRERVKPERDKANRDAHREHWWHYADKRPGLYSALSRLSHCLVISQVTKHLVFAFQPTDRVFSHRLTVIAIAEISSFGVLQSRIHEVWVRLLGSTLEDRAGTGRLCYTTSDVFETFPFPRPEPNTSIPAVAWTATKLYEYRADYMVRMGDGLTKTYNSLMDSEKDGPDIAELRRLHEEMDRAVLDAYGWSDIEVPPYCPKTDAERTAVKAFEDEVIDRLFALNAERAARERAASNDQSKSATPHKPKKSAQSEPKAVTKGSKQKSKKTTPQGQGSLF